MSLLKQSHPRQESINNAQQPSLERKLEGSETKRKDLEREFEIALASTPLKPIYMPIGADWHHGESLTSILFRACNRMGLTGIQPLINELGWQEAKLIRPNQIVQAAKSIRVKSRELATSCPISIDDKSVFFSGHRLDKKHVTTNEIRICAACFQENGFGRKEWQLRALMVCPGHRAPLISACSDCLAQLSNARPGYGQCRCGYQYSSKVNSSSDSAVLVASLLVAKFYGRSTSTYVQRLGLPVDAINAIPLSGLLDLVCILGMAGRDPAKFQLRRLEWPFDGERGVVNFNVASEAVANWPIGLFARLRSVRMYTPWEDSPTQVNKTLDHILRTATHHMQPDAGRLLLDGIAQFLRRPHEWNEHRRKTFEESECLV